ncbi:MAG: hypothetical protein GQ574_04205 [Crocinitomix sp.]|nr:hypothetical protein [Crocinitomix sp.]
MIRHRFSKNEKRIIGLIHLQPLPGTPFYEKGSFQKLMNTALESAEALKKGGAHGCLIQTVDRVYSKNDETDLARVVALTKITDAIAQIAADGFQIGVQVMRNANKAALSIAKLCEGSFIRAETLVGMNLTPHGLIEADPIGLMEYRNKIDAFEIDIVADIHTRHFQWHNASKPVEQIAKYAQMVGANSVCVESKNEEKLSVMIKKINNVCPDLPIILSGYTNHENAKRLLENADGAFVGSCFEKHGWGGVIDEEKVAKYMDIVAR